VSRGHSRFGWRRVAQFRVLALLVVGTLLLCHGVFGALHLCTTVHPGSAGQHAAHKHTSQEAGASHHDDRACHLMHASNYYAVLLTALLGLALQLLLFLKGARFWSRIAAPPAFFYSFRPAVLHPPRGPTASLTLVLQVLRL